MALDTKHSVGMTVHVEVKGQSQVSGSSVDSCLGQT